MQPFVGSKLQQNKQLESDRHCWSCYRDEADLFCSTCVRSFHSPSACSRAPDFLSETEILTWRCPDCLEIEVGIERNGKQQIDAVNLKKVLNFIFNMLIDEDAAFTKPFMSIDYPNGKVVNAMDFNTIKQKIEFGAYRCCEEFWADIKWIVFNTKVHGSADSNTTKALKFLSGTVKEEMYSIQMCHDCYVNLDDDWFEMPCSRPHIVVWAKQRTYPHWPAKLMRFNSERNTIDVRYFGDDHLRAVLPVKDCLLYSEQNPSKTIGRFKKSLNVAVNEADRYIKNLIAKYGSFNYAQPNTALHGDSVERHLYDMIPNAWKELGHSIIPPPIKVEKPAKPNTRRLSLPVQRTQPEFRSEQKPVLTPGRIVTRRMTAATVDLNQAKVDDENSQNAITYRRLSIQIDRFPSELIISIPEGLWTEAKPPIKILKTNAKKRRISLDAPLAKRVKMVIDVNQNEALNESEKHHNPNQDTANESDTKMNIDSNEKAMSIDQPSCESESDQKTIESSASTMVQQNLANHNQQQIQKIPQSSDVAESCEMMVEEDSKHSTAGVQLTQSGKMSDSLDSASSCGQLLQEQWKQQQENYERQIDYLRTENHDLKVTLSEYEKHASKATDIEVKYKSQLNAVSTELEKAQTEIAVLQETNDELKKKKWSDRSCQLM